MFFVFFHYYNSYFFILSRFDFFISGCTEAVHMLLKYGANMNWSPPSGSITAGLSQCGITGTALQVAAVGGWNQIGKKKKKRKTKKNKATKQQRRKKQFRSNH